MVGVYVDPEKVVSEGSLKARVDEIICDVEIHHLLGVLGVVGNRGGLEGRVD